MVSRVNFRSKSDSHSSSKIDSVIKLSSNSSISSCETDGSLVNVGRVHWKECHHPGLLLRKITRHPGGNLHLENMIQVRKFTCTDIPFSLIMPIFSSNCLRYSSLRLRLSQTVALPISYFELKSFCEIFGILFWIRNKIKFIIQTKFLSIPFWWRGRFVILK